MTIDSYIGPMNNVGSCCQLRNRKDKRLWIIGLWPGGVRIYRLSFLIGQLDGAEFRLDRLGKCDRDRAGRWPSGVGRGFPYRWVSVRQADGTAASMSTSEDKMGGKTL